MKSKKRFFGIFGKVLLYTMLILLIVISGMFAFFSNQIKTAVTLTQQKQATENFLPLLTQLKGKTDEEITEFARKFHEENSSFKFCFQNADGKILFQTEDFKIPPDFDKKFFTSGKLITQKNNIADNGFDIGSTGSIPGRIVLLSENGVKLFIITPFTSRTVYGEILTKATWMFGLILVLSFLTAALFAWLIASPVRRIAADTRSMAQLRDVAPPLPRSDEIGQLAEDVYSMYVELKSTIRKLENEMEHVKAIEENQRYFFSAASHELKTPIAATSAILEGLLGDVITPDEYPAYLRECMKLNMEQTRLVSEILDIVKLGDNIGKRELVLVTLSDCVNDVLPPIIPIIEAKGQQLTVEISKDITCTLDTRLFSKALSNIILNAAQNSPENSEIRVWATERVGSVRLSVWNGNSHIPTEALYRLYEPFYRADEARTAGSGRNGLGLTIVQKALQLQGFPFAIENTSGGVLFWVDIDSAR